MNIVWNDFLRLRDEVGFKYIDKNRGLPYGGVRLFSEDPNGEPHSIVLTRKEFSKYFGLNIYRELITSNYKSDIRLFDKPWYEYDEEEYSNGRRTSKYNRRPTSGPNLERQRLQSKVKRWGDKHHWPTENLPEKWTENDIKYYNKIREKYARS